MLAEHFKYRHNGVTAYREGKAVSSLNWQDCLKNWQSIKVKVELFGLLFCVELKSNLFSSFEVSSVATAPCIFLQESFFHRCRRFTFLVCLLL